MFVFWIAAQLQGHRAQHDPRDCFVEHIGNLTFNNIKVGFHFRTSLTSSKNTRVRGLQCLVPSDCILLQVLLTALAQPSSTRTQEPLPSHRFTPPASALAGCQVSDAELCTPVGRSGALTRSLTPVQHGISFSQVTLTAKPVGNLQQNDTTREEAVAAFT